MTVIQKYYYKAMFPPIIPEGQEIKPYCEEVDRFHELDHRFNYAMYIIRGKNSKRFTFCIRTLWPHMEHLNPFDDMIENTGKSIVYSKHDHSTLSNYSKIITKIKNPVLKQKQISYKRMGIILRSSIPKSIPVYLTRSWKKELPAYREI